MKSKPVRVKIFSQVPLL